MTIPETRPDDLERLRRFKAEFFKALTHPLRIAILELLRGGPMGVGELQEALGAGSSAISQQLAILRYRGIVSTERVGATVRCSVPNAEVFALLDSARLIFYGHLNDTAELLRLVTAETGNTGQPGDPSRP